MSLEHRAVRLRVKPKRSKREEKPLTRFCLRYSVTIQPAFDGRRSRKSK
jgi:hypothetical protein